MIYDVYYIEKNSKAPLLVRGLRVINGGYNLLPSSNKNVLLVPDFTGNPRGVKAYKTGQITSSSVDYNTVLMKWYKKSGHEI